MALSNQNTLRKWFPGPVAEAQIDVGTLVLGRDSGTTVKSTWGCLLICGEKEKTVLPGKPHRSVK